MIKMECENSGHCSDREWLVLTHSTDFPVDIQVIIFWQFILITDIKSFSSHQYGACLFSGQYVSAPEPICDATSDHMGVGCR